jgi:16S rRNA (adenine1518-N6/adenine1519-N6)-dimethyltransferase
MSIYKHTRELLQDAGIRPRKRFGQNFLIDQSVLNDIINAASLSSHDTVIEIGAGTGILTRFLASYAGEVFAVEIDEGLFRILESVFRDTPNVSLIHDDILELDLPALPDILSAEAVKIVGNLPYYITSPILIKMLDESSSISIKTILVMVQEEVGKRITASPGSKDYGALSIAVGYHSNAEILRHVSARSFYPRPKVDSVLIKLNIMSQPRVKVKDQKLFFQIVKAAFQYRRKTLRNALLLMTASGEIKIGDSINFILDNYDFDFQRRGETLSIEEFAKIANAIYKENEIRE